MGERSQADWSEELETNGQVVFTTRPRWVLKLLGVIWLLVILQGLRALTSDSTEGSIRQVFLVLFLALAVGGTAWYGWRILTHYPMLTVGPDGIRMGRNRFLRWAEVRKVGLVSGGLGQKRVPILPKDQSAKELSIDQSAIKDMPGFARWLEGVLAEKRAI
ncbi:hypothetical protein AB0P21_21120 [Kribbella sp. NPDC056861]|uniref:hypothetical protein n=1 Tax=Kribbella sp. NPDC056861 TaxID=3154857 RepID=UPI003445CA5B